MSCNTIQKKGRPLLSTHALHSSRDLHFFITTTALCRNLHYICGLTLRRCCSKSLTNGLNIGVAVQRPNKIYPSHRYKHWLKAVTWFCCLSCTQLCLNLRAARPSSSGLMYLESTDCNMTTVHASFIINQWMVANSPFFELISTWTASGEKGKIHNNSKKSVCLQWLGELRNQNKLLWGILLSGRGQCESD